MISRRQFMASGSLCAGGLAVPAWARWLSDCMLRLQPRRVVLMPRPACRTLTYDRFQLFVDGKEIEASSLIMIGSRMDSLPLSEALRRVPKSASSVEVVLASGEFVFDGLIDRPNTHFLIRGTDPNDMPKLVFA